MKIRWKKVIYFVMFLGSLVGFKNVVGQNEHSFIQNEKNNINQHYSISGIVLENDSITPIPFCNILLLNNDSVIIGTTIADFDGKFNFDKLTPNRYSISISIVGYKTLIINDINTNHNAYFSTFLSPIVINLEEVEIIEYKLCYLISKEPESKRRTIPIDNDLPLMKEKTIEKPIKKENTPNSNEIFNSDDIKNMPIRR
jgi:hypothetical protein